MNKPRSIIEELVASSGGGAAFRRRMLDTGVVTQMDGPLLESWGREAVDFRSLDPFTKTTRLLTATGSRLPLQWLCGRLGVFFVPGHASFAPILGRGPETWFAASLQIHDLRRTVIKAFLDSPRGKPSIDEHEGRLIAKRWATVFGWIEGFLGAHGDCRRLPDTARKIPPPVLFRTTPVWQLLAEAVNQAKNSRAEIAEQVAHPFGKQKQDRRGQWTSPRENALDKWLLARPDEDEKSKGTRGPLDYTLALCLAANSLEPLHWLAGQSGGYLVCPPLPAVEPQEEPLRFWERTMVELAELDASIARAFLDGAVKPDEVARLRKEWTDVVTWMRAFSGNW